jgi:hypothetical protein
MSSFLEDTLKQLRDLGASVEEAERVMRRVIATQDALRKHKGVDFNLYVRACRDGEPHAIASFADWLLQESKKHEGDESAPARRGLAVPIAVINDCASVMLRWSLRNRNIPESLFYLIEHQLGADKEGARWTCITLSGRGPPLILPHIQMPRI